MVIAIIALFVALGGTGYAASSGLIAGASDSPLAQCRGSVHDALRFKSDGTKQQRAAATRAICEPQANGQPGAKGDPGPPGPAAPASYAEFYALMPGDNPATVAAGSAVEFPEDGPSHGGIARTGPSTFVLPEVGTYRVTFSVPVNEPGQLVLTLNSVELPYTVYGRATGTTPIAGESLVTTTAANSVVSVVNAAGNSPALTITTSAGGTHPAVASLVVERLP